MNATVGKAAVSPGGPPAPLDEKGFEPADGRSGGRHTGFESNLTKAPSFGLVWPAGHDVLFDPTGGDPGTPYLAVEINFPGDLGFDPGAKAFEFPRAGAGPVRVADPTTRAVCDRRANDSFGRLTENDGPPGGGGLPGFRCRVAALFPPTDGGEGR